jgi:hypothetical protein
MTSSVTEICEETMATQDQRRHRPANDGIDPPRDIVRELDPGLEIEAGYREQGRRSKASGPSDPTNTVRPGANRGHLHDLLDAALDFGGQVARTGREATRQFIQEGSGQERCEFCPREGLGLEAVRQLFLDVVRRLVPGALAPRPSRATPEAAVLALPSARPGHHTGSDLDVHNTSLEWIDGLRLRCPALVAVDGSDRILGHHVTFHPGVVNIAPNHANRVRIRLEIPPDVRAGSYIGLIEADGLPGTRSLIMIDVV